MEKQYERKSSIKIPKSKNKTAYITIIKSVFVWGKNCSTYLSVSQNFSWAWQHFKRRKDPSPRQSVWLFIWFMKIALKHVLRQMISEEGYFHLGPGMIVTHIAL